MPKSKRDKDPKVNALKKDGTLNPVPEKVIDELFCSNDFFDPRDMMQVKYEMLRRVKEDGWSISEAARVFGLSRVSFYQALSSFDQAGLSGFIPRQRGPREAHKLSGPVIKFIEATKQKDQSIHTAGVIRLIKEQFGIDVHRRSIERALTRAKKKLQ